MGKRDFYILIRFAIFRKRSLLFCNVTLLLAIASAANAQSYVGALAGANFANQTGKIVNGNIEFSSSLGYVFGGVIGTALSSNIDLHLEPIFLKKTTKQMGQQQRFGKFENSLSANYAEISAFLKYTFGAAKARPYLMGGIGFGFRFDAEFRFNSDSLSTTFMANDLLQVIDLNYAICGGINFDLDKFSLFIEGRYSVGIVDIFLGGQGFFDRANLITFDDFEVKYKGIFVLAGITFPLTSGTN